MRRFFLQNIFRRNPSTNHRKPLKLPRPCFPMARQCVKLRRTNPAHAEGNLLRSEPELGVLSCSAVHMEGVLASRPEYCLQHFACSPTSLQKQPRLYKKLEDHASGWVRRYAGPGTYLLTIVINGIGFESVYLFACSHLLCLLSYACISRHVHLVALRG